MAGDFHSAYIDEIQQMDFDSAVLKILLTDKTTKRNIIWATDDYISYGESYNKYFPIMIDQITGKSADIIRPRVLKSKTSQTSRKKNKAEVFTPSQICNNQINLVDNAWFGRQGVFNVPTATGWKINENQIDFEEKPPHRWKDYIDLKRLEITCGEAPYITSRYDMQSGSFIPVRERIGMLDRKLRIVSENTNSLEEWIMWATRSIESIYGFEFQGDSLIIARENVLFTFAEHMKQRFDRLPDIKLLKKIANIIAWNIWQMDAFTCSVPYQRIAEQFHQISFVENKQACTLCRIHDWRSNVTLKYTELFKESGTVGKH